MIETITQNVTTSQLQLTCTQHSCTLYTDQELFAEPPEESESCENDVWDLHKALYDYRKAPKLWYHHVVSLLESRNCHPLLTDPSCSRNDELDNNIFIHVDDGLLFDRSIDILRLIELLSDQVMMRIVERLVRLGDQILFLGRELSSRTTHDLQEHKRWSFAVGNATLSACSRTQQSAGLTSAEADCMP